MSRTGAGRLAAFEQVVERYQNAVSAVAYSRTRDRALSQDIAQETFLIAWSQHDRLRDPDKLGAWLCGIARNLSSKALRPRQRERIADDLALAEHADEAASPLDAALETEAERAVWSALEHLSPSYREPLVLFYRENQSIRDVARGLGLSEETVKQRLSRGRQALRTELTAREQRALAAGRPGKALTAAVLALIAAGAVPHAAAASAGLGHSGGKLAAGAAIALAIAVGAGSVWRLTAGDPAGAGRATQRSPRDRAVVAALAATRAADTRIASAVRARCKLSGVVTAADGSPLAGAHMSTGEGSGAAFDAVMVDTDASGRWSLESAATNDASVSIVGAGHRAIVRRMSCADTTGSRSSSTRLTADGIELAGSVSDVGGGPIADAIVWVISGENLAASAVITRTAADGAFRVLLAPGRYQVRVVHPDYIADDHPVTMAPARPVREEFLLFPGASIEGTVVDGSTGAPIAGARVVRDQLLPSEAVDSASPRWIQASITAATVPTLTDEQGRFRLNGLPPGRIGLTARTDDRATVEPGRVELAIAEIETGVVVPIGGGSTIAGFVVARGNDRRGLAGVTVMAVPEGFFLRIPAMVVSDDWGHFSIGGLQPGRYRMIATSRDTAALFDDEPVEIGEQDVLDLLLTVDRGVVVRGRVEPPGPVAIRLAAAGNDSTVAETMAAALTRVDSDDDGNFVLRSLLPGKYQLTARRLDAAGELSFEVGRTDVDQLVIALDALPSVRGQIVDAAGAAQAGLVVALEMADSSPTETGALTARTDASGRFELPGVPIGVGKLRVFDRGGERPRLLDDDAPSLTPLLLAVMASGVDTTIRVVSAAGTINGRVFGPDGAAVADAWLEIRIPGGRFSPLMNQIPPIITDEDGRFAISDVHGDEIEICATGARGRLGSPWQSFSTVAPLEIRLTKTLPDAMTADDLGADLGTAHLFDVKADDEEAGGR